MDFYRRAASDANPPPPHIFLTAAQAYDAMREAKSSQSILISGASFYRRVRCHHRQRRRRAARRSRPNR